MIAEASRLLEKTINEKDHIQKARCLKVLIEEHNLRIKDLAVELHIHPSYVCHLLRLNNLPEYILDGYYSDLVKLSHLFIISRLKDKEQINKVYETVLADNLTVLQTESLVRELLYSVKTDGIYLTKEEKNSISRLVSQDDPQIQVNLIQSRIKTKLIIEIKGSLKDSGTTLRKILKRISG